MSNEFLHDRKDSLVEEFFHKEEAKKMAALKAKLEEEKTREGLRAASCVDDDELLDKLLDLGVSADTLTAMSLVPLVHVAWADGRVEPEERDAVLQAARGKGVKEDAPAAELLSAWLDRGEPPELYDVWARYVAVLCEQLTPKQKEVLEKQIVDFARSVAEAAGGFLGIKKVSAKEEEALQAISRAFAEAGSA